MQYIIYTYVFIIGAILGSFYNVVGLRVSQKKSIVYPGSSCPNCGHELSWWELIPILNYFFLVGKCRECKSRISTRYLIIEILTGSLFLMSYLVIGFNWELLVALTFISLLMIITVSDLEYMLIEDVIIIVFLVMIIIERLFITMPDSFISFSFEFSTFRYTSIVESLIGGLFGFGLLYSIAFIGKKIYNKEVMGGGDIKLYGIIGLVIGFKLTFLSLFLASILGSVLGMILISFKIVKKDTPIPFGPFIAASSLIAYFIGPAIIDWYFGLFNYM